MPSTNLLSSSFILTEGAVIERIRRDGRVPLHPLLEHAGFVNDPVSRAYLERIYREYIDIGRRHGVPIMVGTPTWRANPERSRSAGQSCDDLNTTCAQFLNAIRATYREYASKVIIAGLLGCKGDAYEPRASLSSDDAAAFHRQQAEALSRGGTDLLMAATLPALGEARGIAIAMADTASPYIISFVTDGDGCVLDGTPLDAAIGSVDDAVQRKPLGYMVNCVHPAPFRKTYMKATLRSPGIAERIIGLQANTSPRSPSELDGLPRLETEDPTILAESMIRLNEDFGLRVLGGCCGTDGRHIEELAARMAHRIRVSSNDGNDI